MASAKASKQYLTEVMEDRNMPNVKALVDVFTEKFFSHGYPMDYAFLSKNGIDVSEPDSEAESLVHELRDHYKEVIASDEHGDVSIIHSGVGHAIIRDCKVTRKIYQGKPKQA